MLVLIGVAAAFRTAFLPHTKSSVASKLAQTNHPVAVPPAQWLPVFLAASTPGPPTHHRRLGEVTLITTKAELKTAVGEYNANVTAAEDTYGPINNWDVSGITDMSYLFDKLGNFNADISSWNTSSVTTMVNMFKVRTLAPTSYQPRALPCMPLAPRRPRPLPAQLPARTSPRIVYPPCDSAESEDLQPTAKLRHVAHTAAPLNLLRPERRRHRHGWGQLLALHR